MFFLSASFIMTENDQRRKDGEEKNNKNNNVYDLCFPFLFVVLSTDNYMYNNEHIF